MPPVSKLQLNGPVLATVVSSDVVWAPGMALAGWTEDGKDLHLSFLNECDLLCNAPAATTWHTV